ncbi:MAG: TetR family transcriptional regulator [Leucobacter sp.]
MAEPQKRNTERTRRAVLDAAMHAILDRGTGVTLAEIAESAGVSKSGLIHHFGNRDQLFVAVVKDMSEQLREAVVAELDLSENHPGKMLRAYVRALCKGGAEAVAARDFTSAANWNGLYAIPAIAALLEEDDAWWSEQFAADGLSDERIQIVRRAAEGVVAAALQVGEDQSSIASARRLLLELATKGTFRQPL